MSVQSNFLWTDVELGVAVEAYLYLSRLQQSGASFSERDLNTLLLSGPLRRRNRASVRYRMRNISFVIEKRGWRSLPSFSPAQQVGSGVMARIEAILDSHSAAELTFLKKLSPNLGLSDKSTSSTADRNEAIARLEKLDEALRDLQRELVGIGHNRPPEPIEEYGLTADEVSLARAYAAELKTELDHASINRASIERLQDRLLHFGLKLAAWVGGRITKFADAALVTLAPIVVAKATNVLPLIADVIGALRSLLGH